MRPILLALTLSFACAIAQAQPWTPSDCGSKYAVQWDEFTREMKEATPSSPIYAPRPFPQKNSEILEDLPYGYERMFKGMSAEEVPPEDQAVLEGLKARRFAYKIDRVENWAETQCLPAH